MSDSDEALRVRVRHSNTITVRGGNDRTASSAAPSRKTHPREQRCWSAVLISQCLLPCLSPGTGPDPEQDRDHTHTLPLSHTHTQALFLLQECVCQVCFWEGGSVSADLHLDELFKRFWPAPPGSEPTHSQRCCHESNTQQSLWESEDTNSVRRSRVNCEGGKLTCVQQNISVSLWLTDTFQSLFTWRLLNKHESELNVQIEKCDLDPFHYFLCRFGSKFTFNDTKIWTEGISVSSETESSHLHFLSVSQLTYNWWSQTLVLLLSVGPSRPGSGLWNSIMWVCQQVKMCERCSCIYISGCFSLQTIW